MTIDTPAIPWLGMGLGLGPVAILIILITIPWLWGKWVAPLMVVLPVTCHWVGASRHPLATFSGIAFGVFLYILGLLIIAFVGTLRKPRLPLTKGKDKKDD